MTDHPEELPVTPLSEALALSAAEYRERYRLGPESWYVVLPSQYEQRSAEVVAAYVRMRDHGHGLPAGLIGVEFAAGRHDPRPVQLRRVTFPDGDPEAEAIARYREALAAGLSDHEAREDGWPS